MNRLFDSARRFIAELRRRRVIRVAVVYAIVAFTILQAGDVLFPALRLPDWAMSFLAALVILGFPVAVALAWAFDITSEGVVRTASREHASKDSSDSRPVPKAAWFVLGVLVALSGAWFGASHLGWSDGGADLDEDLVAVLPFRVAGADPQYSYLREGMLDLLAAKLTGEWGPRAVDPRTMMAQWRQVTGDDGADVSGDDALVMARQVGARRVILGELVSAPGQLVITASVLDAARRGSAVPVTVEGPADSLTALVDRLTATLLSQEAGEEEHRLAGLTSTSLPALRAYLSARADYRAGRFESALDGFQQALALDSTFALAAFGLHRASGWTPFAPAAASRTALEQAWAHQDRLSPRDRLYLQAIAGPDYPAPATARQRLDTWERVLDLHPDDPEAWYELADILLHYGRLLGDGAMERARGGFQRAVELDPGYAPALLHLADVAGQTGDTTQMRQVVERYEEVGPADFYAELVSAFWQRLTGTAGVEERLRERLRNEDQSSRLGFAILFPFWHMGLAFPWSDALETAEYATELARESARTRDERQAAARVSRDLALNRGRLSDAAAALDGLREAGADSLSTLALEVEAALYWDGDPVRAARAAEALEGSLGPPEGWREEALARAPYGDRLCTLHQWRLSQGETAGIRQAAGALRAAAEANPRAGTRPSLCADLLDAWAAHIDGSPEADARIEALRRHLLQGPPTQFLSAQATLALARLLEERGDLSGALQVSQWEIYLPEYSFYSSTFLRTQARLAAALGEDSRARTLYEVYLVLVPDPDPGTRPAEEAERAREALAGLGGAS